MRHIVYKVDTRPAEMPEADRHCDALVGVRLPPSRYCRRPWGSIHGFRTTPTWIRERSAVRQLRGMVKACG